MDDVCGHELVDNDGVIERHQIPDDGAPHAPTSECGCSVTTVTENDVTVYIHTNQDPQEDPCAEDWS